MTVAVGTTEIGQGMVTVLSQIAAEALGCPVELVQVVEADTSRVPDSGPTVASRTTRDERQRDPRRGGARSAPPWSR